MMERRNETKWITQAKQGDAAAFGHLAESYGNAVLATAISRVGDYSTSEDIAQDALLLAFEKLSSLRNPSAFPAWLLKITRNLCARWHRNQAYRAQLRQDGIALRARLGYEAAPSAAMLLEKQETKLVLWKAMEKLPDTERDALLLFYFHGQSVAEAAQAAGIAPAALRKRLQRGRDRLRDVLHAEVQAGLHEVGQERRLKDRVLAAAPLGAAFSKLENVESVVPHGATLWLEGLRNGATTLGAKTVLAAVVGGVILASAFYWHSARPKNPPTRTTAVEANTGAAASAVVDEMLAKSPFAEEVVGEVVMAKAAVKTADALSTTPSSVFGTVHDSSGKTLANATVKVLRKTGESGCGSPLSSSREVIATATTDTKGAYRLAGMPDDEDVLVFAIHEDWAVAGRKVDTGHDAGPINFTLSETVTASGQVVNENGAGLADAAVSIGTITMAAWKDGKEKPKADTGNNVSASAFGGLLIAVTDERGRFNFPNLPEGGVISSVRAHKKGYGMGQAESAEGLRRQQADFASKGSTVWGSTSIPLPAKDIRIVLKPSGALEGLARFADGRPASRAEISVSGHIPSAFNGGNGGSFSTEAIADEEGRFRFEDVPAIKLDQIEAELGKAISPKLSAYIRSNESTQVELILEQGGRITGILYDATQNLPVPKARIYYQQEGILGGLPLAWTDKQGRFELEGLAPGRWKIGTNRGEWNLDPEHHANSKEMMPIPVEVLPGETVANLELYATPGKWATSEGGVLAGRVLNASGRALPKAAVWLVVNGSERRIEADDAGRYRFERLSAGKCTVYAAHPKEDHYGTAKVTLERKGAEQLDLVVNLEAARVRGSLRSPEDAPPVSPVRLGLWRDHPTDSWWWNLSCDGSGDFDSGPIPPGRYELMAQAMEEGFTLDKDRGDAMEVKAGEIWDVPTMILRRMEGALAGRARYADGRPFAHERVIAGSMGGLLRGETDAEGRFRLEPIDGDNAYLAFGQYPQFDDIGKEWAWISDVAVRATDLDIVIGPMGHLKGQLDLEEGDSARLTLTAASYSPSFIINVHPPDFDIPMQPGTYRANITINGQQKQLGEIVIATGQTIDLGALAIPEGTSVLRGSVTYGGIPLTDSEQSRIQLHQLGEGDTPEYSPKMQQEEGGGFYAEQLAAGRYTLQVVLTREGQHQIEHHILEMEADTDLEMNIDFPSGEGSIEGAVTSQGGRMTLVLCGEAGLIDLESPLNMTSIAVHKQFIRAKCAGDGSFTLSGIPAGNYDVFGITEDVDGTISYGVQTVTIDNGEIAGVQIQADRPMAQPE
jgi:RNA polymerase sigma factor (sigma-70 family)